MLKTNNTSLIFLITIIVLLFATCCKNDDCNDEIKLAPITYRFNLGDSKDYLYFKAGSWWVYKNMQNNKLDTIYCYEDQYETRTLKGNEPKTKHRTFIYDYFMVRTYSPQFKRFYETYHSGKNVNTYYPIDTNANTFEKYKSFASSGGGIEPCFFTPYDINSDRGGVTFLQDTNNTITLQNNTYTNVKVFKITMDSSFPDILDEINFTHHPSLIYYAKNIGIIKYEFPVEGKSIELIDYHIIQ